MLKGNTMKLKLILCLLGVFSLLKVNAALGIGNDEISEKVLIEMKGNDVPFDILTNGDLGDHRSVQPLIPIFVMLDGSNNTLDLYFEQAIGEVDVTISQNGVVLYFSSEYIQTSVLKNIQLELDVSGSFLIEIEGKNGAYACGQFEL